MVIDITTLDEKLVNKLVKQNHVVYFDGDIFRFICTGIVEKPEFLEEHEYEVMKEYEEMDLYTYDEQLKEKLEKAGYWIEEDDKQAKTMYRCPHIYEIPKQAKGHKYEIHESQEEFIDPRKIEAKTQLEAKV